MTAVDVVLPFPPLEQPNPPARPSSYGDEINRLVAKGLLDDVVRWLEDDFKPGQEAEIEEQLFNALDRAFAMDGFQLAKRLSDHGWDCDSELVEILDSAGGHAWSVHSDLVKAWVAANGITLKMGLGARVEAARHGPGTIVGLRPETAEYVVQTDKWLAERSAEPGWRPEDQKGSGLILAAESLTHA